MCSNSKIIQHTKNGILTYCSKTNITQLVFKNLCFEFYECEYISFAHYILDMDESRIEKLNSHSYHTRKIPISIGHVCFTILMNKEEIAELKQLFTSEYQPIKTLSFSEIDYRLIEN